MNITTLSPYVSFNLSHKFLVIFTFYLFVFFFVYPSQFSSFAKHAEQNFLCNTSVDRRCVSLLTTIFEGPYKSLWRVANLDGFSICLSLAGVSNSLFVKNEWSQCGAVSVKCVVQSIWCCECAMRCLRVQCGVLNMQCDVLSVVH